MTRNLIKSTARHKPHEKTHAFAWSRSRAALLAALIISEGSGDGSPTTSGLSPLFVPPEMTGRCLATCVVEKGSGYQCPYLPTYPVWWRANGTFNWRAPYRNGSDVEIGNGQILSPVTEVHHADGSWQARWYGGNHLLAPASSHSYHVTHCACYYAKGLGMGQSWYLSNYAVATVANSAQFAVETVCKPYNIANCPESNATAFQRWGPPWIEAYLGCNQSQVGSARIDMLVDKVVDKVVDKLVNKLVDKLADKLLD